MQPAPSSSSAGLFLAPARGPGFLIVFIGAGLIAEESYLAARTLDWIELRVRRLADRARRRWKSASPALKARIVVDAAFAAAGSALAAYAIFMD